MRLSRLHRQKVLAALAKVEGLTREPEIRCAWCAPTPAVAPSAGLVSHGMCAQCAVAFEAEAGIDLEPERTPCRS